MIAIAILGVGGVMVAALFPAAVKENQVSVNDTLGNIICQNALAIVKAQSSTLALPGSLGEIVLSDDDIKYPTQADDNSTNRGFRVIGYHSSGDIYNLFIFSYQMGETHAARHTEAVVNTSNAEITNSEGTIIWFASSDDADRFPLGNSVLVIISGADPTVSSITTKLENNRIMIDPPIPVSGPPQAITIWTVTEFDSGGNPVDRRAVMNVFSTRAALQE